MKSTLQPASGTPATNTVQEKHAENPLQLLQEKPVTENPFQRLAVNKGMQTAFNPIQLLATQRNASAKPYTDPPANIGYAIQFNKEDEDDSIEKKDSINMEFNLLFAWVTSQKETKDEKANAVFEEISTIQASDNILFKEAILVEFAKLLKENNPKKEDEQDSGEGVVQGKWDEIAPFVAIGVVLLALYLLYQAIKTSRDVMGVRMSSFNTLQYGATSSEAIDNKSETESTFTNWISGRRGDPGTSLNCWELILYTAYDMGKITRQDIAGIYRNTMQEGGGALFVIMKALGWKPSQNQREATRQRNPQRGDFVTFYSTHGGVKTHAGYAISAGNIVQINRGRGFTQQVETLTLQQTLNTLSDLGWGRADQIAVLSFQPDWTRLKKNQ